MTRRLITAVGVAMAFAVAAAHASDPGSDQCRLIPQCHTIPRDRYPDGCHPNGWAMTGGGGADFLNGIPKRRNLLLGGSGNDTIEGRNRADCLFGQSGGDNAINGGSGDDWLRGDDGTDYLYAGGDDDLIQGGRANDEIVGGAGNNSIHGGPGSERTLRRVGGGSIGGSIRGGSGRDLIVDIKGHNEIDCGVGIDRVVSNEQSRVAANCEHITRR